MSQQVSRTGGDAASGAASVGDEAAHLATVFFTGPVLAIIAITASGKWLGMLFVLPRKQNGKFGLPIRGFVDFTATGEEVLLGLTAFILTVGLLGVTVRGNIGPFVESDFGLHIGQFVSLCFISSLTILAVAVSTFVIKLIVALPIFHQNSLVKEQQKRIEALPDQNR